MLMVILLAYTDGLQWDQVGIARHIKGGGGLRPLRPPPVQHPEGQLA